MSHKINLNILKNKLAQALPGMAVQQAMAPVNRILQDPAMLKPGSFRPSAVMVLLYPDHQGDWHFPLIQRVDYPGIHGGQVSLPGGKPEGPHESLQETALRECREEIGLPAEPEWLGKLSPLFIPVSGYLVQPFVAAIDTVEPFFVIQQEEVQGLIQPGLKDLLDESNRSVGEVPIRGGKVQAPYFSLSGKVVWGATAMILNELRELVLSDTPLR